jgi:predicted RND superfamily exporter protein
MDGQRQFVDAPLLVRAAAKPLSRPWWTLLLSIAGVVAIASGARLLTMNSDYRAFFSKDNPQVAAFDALNAMYTKDDNILIAVEPVSGTVFTPEVLSAIDELVKIGWRIPFATRVDAITNFQRTRADGDDLYIEDIVVQPRSLKDSDLTAIEAAVLNEPELVNRLVSPSGDITAVNVTLKFPGTEIGEEFKSINAVREQLDAFRAAHPELRIYTSGVAMLFAGFSEAMQRDMRTLVPMTFIVALIVVWLATRSIVGTVGALIVAVLAIACAMGAAGYLGIQFTAPIAAVPTMLMTLAVADSVHILGAVQRGLRRGLPKMAAVLEAVTLNVWPVVLTGATTAIGFLSLNSSDVPPFRDLGNMTAIGILAACVVSLTFLPAFLLVVPFRAQARAPRAHALGATVAGSFYAFIGRRHRVVVVASVAVSLGFALLATRNVLNDQMLAYLDSRIAFRQDTEHIAQRLTGIYTVEYSVSAGRSGDIADPVYLGLVRNFRAWLSEQPGVIHVTALDQVVGRINRAMDAASAAQNSVPTEPSRAAQYLLLYEMSLPYGLDLNNAINVDKSASRVVATVKNLDGEELIALSERGERWLQTHNPTRPPTHGISMPLIFAHLVRRQIHSMFSGTVWSVLLIAGLLGLALRSVRYGAVALVSITLPIVVAFGVWTLVRGEITGGLALVAGMALGIIDDDVVHIVTKFREAVERDGTDARAALPYVMQTAGGDVVVTSVALIAGFVTLAQSSFGLFFDLGKLTAVVIGASLVLNLVFLPALLVWLAERRAPRQGPSFADGRPRAAIA